LVGPQFIEDEAKDWRRHVPAGAVFFVFTLILLLLISDLRNFVFSPFLPLLEWSRDQGNASAIQAITATLQAVGTALLLAITWHSIRVSRDDANEARMQARAAYHQARASERKASIGELRREKLAFRPILVLVDPKSKRDLFDEVQFIITNVGQGPALHIDITVTELHLPYAPKTQGELRPLLVGESTVVDLALKDPFTEVVIRRVILEEEESRPEKPTNVHGWTNLAEITVECMDARGEMWESGAKLTYDPKEGSFQFFETWFSYPAEVLFGA
jgi:hypothetical protein